MNDKTKAQAQEEQPKVVSPEFNETTKQMLVNKYGKGLLVVKLEADEDNPEEYFVFKKPKMRTISSFAQFEQDDPVRAAQIMFNDCLVHGDKGASQDPERFLSILPHMAQLNKVRKASVEKL